MGTASKMGSTQDPQLGWVLMDQIVKRYLSQRVRKPLGKVALQLSTTKAWTVAKEPPLLLGGEMAQLS